MRQTSPLATEQIVSLVLGILAFGATMLSLGLTLGLAL